MIKVLLCHTHAIKIKVKPHNPWHNFHPMKQKRLHFVLLNLRHTTPQQYPNLHHGLQHVKRTSVPKERSPPEAPHLSPTRVNFQHLNYERGGGNHKHPKL
jgi:hypothetical protein